MYKKINSLLLIITLSISSLYAQSVTGNVFESNEYQKILSLPGASIFWAGTTIGTSTDSEGYFKIQRIHNNNMLVVRFVGFTTDTLHVTDTTKHLHIVLRKDIELSEVKIISNEAMFISSRPILTQLITTEGLRKAACCNLSESFENTVSVDVSYSDAVTGAKQIQMLGLAGIYSQIMLENTPYLRGLSAPFGLMYIPGSWMENISISKGTASVTNGYEAITGQIDINYKKPETNNEKLFVNLFLNSTLKSELNFNTRFQTSENSSSMFLFHFENQALKIDGNQDGFMDIPLSTQVNFMNRWDYEKRGKMEGRTMASYLYETRQGGQMKFDKNKDRLTQNAYGIGIENHRFNIISKNGILLPGNYESICSILSMTYHDFSEFTGLTTYSAKQISGYANIIYENFMDKKEQHKINTGASYQIDSYSDAYSDTLSQHIESVPGIFAQYSFIFKEKFVAIAGFRVDYNNLYGIFLTPRMHVKWEFIEHSSIRFSAGKGYRSPHIYIDNTALMSTSRTFVIQEKLKVEEAWNTGISFTQSFKTKGNESTFILDYFYTDFKNQVIVDIDQSPQFVYFYNSNGKKSYSHSIQAELMLYPFKGIEIITAYRFNNVMQTMNGQLKEKAMTPAHKALITLGYATKFDKWKFNLTTQFHGAQRLPFTQSNPEEYRLTSHSPFYITMNAQITKKFKLIEIYVGGENLTNYKQEQPIVSAEDPFNQYFDSSIIWGPIDGIMIYCGMRFTLKGKNNSHKH